MRRSFERRDARRGGAAQVVDSQPTSEPEAQRWGVGPEGPLWFAALSAAMRGEAQVTSEPATPKP